MNNQVSAGFGSSSAPNDCRNAVLVTCYMTGSTEGRNLGTAGYSYDFVTRLFVPLLERWGEVIPVPDPKLNLESAAQAAWKRGLRPIHVSFLPFQDICLSQTVPNVAVPAWEFPDVPDHEFDGNPQNDWVATADRCDLVIVGGPFTRDALRRGGARVPIRIVQVPTPDDYFHLRPWRWGQAGRVDCAGCHMRQHVSESSAAASVSAWRESLEFRKEALKQAGKSFERTIRQLNRCLLGPTFYARLSEPLAGKWKAVGPLAPAKSPNPAPPAEGKNRPGSLELSGVVYTSLFNPDDGRKNWQDLLTGFLLALGDCEDATLVLKLITRRPESVERVMNYYRNRDIPHRCKLVIISDFLSDQQLLELAEASTYYVQATKAEGNCLPLMNYLAAGRPGISPVHSAIGDYFDSDQGWLVDWHPEPAAWPHDRRLRLRTSWGRIVWPSLTEQLRASYHVAKTDAAAYTRLAAACRMKMQRWAGYEAVWARLRRALDELSSPVGRETNEVIPFPAFVPRRKAA